MDNALLMQIGSYVLVFIIPIIFLSKYLDWLPFKVMRVKSSGGKKVLLRKRLPVGNKYFVASMDDKDGVWNEKAGILDKNNKGRITIPHDAIHTEFGGCKVVEFDSEGRLYNPDGTIVSGFDAKHLQDLLEREAEKPDTDDGTKKLTIILILVSILAAGISAYLAFKNSQKMDALLAAYDGLKQVLINTTVHNIQ